MRRIRVHGFHFLAFDPLMVSSELKHSAIKIDVKVAEKQAIAMLLSNSQT